MRTNPFFCIIFLTIGFCDGGEGSVIRLAGGRDDSEGRVEIYSEGSWGTVCDDNWDIYDANVVCHQLGFSGAIEAVIAATFGPGSGKIWMDDVRCSGTEVNLLDCAFRGLGSHDCSHSEDAGVRCMNHKYDLDNSAGFSDQLGKLFDDGRECDVKITVVVDNNATEEICTHRVILSLYPNLTASHPDLSNLTINVSGNCSQFARTFVRYFYTRKIQFRQSSAHCLLKMASAWGLTELQTESPNIYKEFLPDDSTFLTQLFFYEYAVSTGDEVLRELYLRYLAWNCERLIQSPGWTDLPFDVVGALLSRSDLVVPNETVTLKALERWAAARGNASVPESLMKFIRFPMIPAEDLLALNDSRYSASKFQGFQFNALPFTTLLSVLTEEQNLYTSRIYTDKPWSFTFDFDTVYKSVGFYADNGQRLSDSASDFQTPLHNSAYFTYNNVRWRARVYVNEEDCSNQQIACPSLPAVSLKIEEKNSNLPWETERRIHYNNKLVIRCGEKNVVHVDGFKTVGNENLVFVSNSSEQAFPCDSQRFFYQVVVRPHYSQG